MLPRTRATDYECFDPGRRMGAEAAYGAASALRRGWLLRQALDSKSTDRSQLVALGHEFFAGR
jgi:hypothetical protein